MDIMMIVLLVFTGIIVQQGGSELQEVPALEILNLSGQRSQVGRIIDSTVDFEAGRWRWAAAGERRRQGGDGEAAPAKAVKL